MQDQNIKVNLTHEVNQKIQPLIGQLSNASLIVKDKAGEAWEIQVTLPIGWDLQSFGKTLIQAIFAAGIDVAEITIQDFNRQFLN